jgi:hypothetical protein
MIYDFKTVNHFLDLNSSFLHIRLWESVTAVLAGFRQWSTESGNRRRKTSQNLTSTAGFRPNQARFRPEFGLSNFVLRCW